MHTSTPGAVDHITKCRLRGRLAVLSPTAQRSGKSSNVEGTCLQYHQDSRWVIISSLMTS